MQQTVAPISSCQTSWRKLPASIFPAADTWTLSFLSCPWLEGIYRLDTWIEGNRELQDWVETAAELTVIDGDFYGTGKLHYPGWEGTTVLVRHRFRHVSFPNTLTA